MRNTHQPTTRQLIISLKRNELTYDVDYITYKVARLHFAQQPEQAREVAMQADDSDYADRLFSSALASLKDALRWCVEERDGNVATDQVGPRRDYDLILRRPAHAKWQPKVLATLIHDYMVYEVVGRYLHCVSAEVAAPYVSLAEHTLNSIYGHLRTNSLIKTKMLWK